MRRLKETVQRHLMRTASIRWNKRIHDPRHRRGRRWKFTALMNGAWAGAVTAQENLRAVEELTEQMGRRIPDTTLNDLLLRLSPASLQKLLTSEVRQALRAKELDPTLPFSVTAIDGKAIWSGSYKANRYAQAQKQDDGRVVYVMRVLRATLVGGPCSVVIGQRPVPARAAEMTTFPAFFRQLLRDYGRSSMLDVFSFDAGYISKANADLVDAENRGYVFALKNPQKELVAEAERVLGRRRTADAETSWERVDGRWIRRLLFRTTEMAGYHGWAHLREVWRVRQETRSDDGTITVEERYFLTNLVPGRTAGDIPLRIVRAHWGIENHANWTMDMLWKEDDGPWVAAAAEVVSLMRLLAYNVVMRLRTRHLRSEANRARTWRDLLSYVKAVVWDCTISAACLFEAEDRGLAAAV